MPVSIDSKIFEYYNIFIFFFSCYQSQTRQWETLGQPQLLLLHLSTSHKCPSLHILLEEMSWLSWDGSSSSSECSSSSSRKVWLRPCPGQKWNEFWKPSPPHYPPPLTAEMYNSSWLDRLQSRETPGWNNGAPWVSKDGVGKNFERKLMQSRWHLGSQPLKAQPAAKPWTYPIANWRESTFPECWKGPKAMWEDHTEIPGFGQNNSQTSLQAD